MDVDAEMADVDFGDADFGDDDGFDDDGFGDDNGWDDDDAMELDSQQYIPITAAGDEESSEEYELDKDGNIIITPNRMERQKSLSRQKSVDNQCWTCSNCKATNKLSWTLTVEQFLHKCCICRQATYSPLTKVFESDIWDEPSNDHWECDRCTLHNAIGRNACTACSHPHKLRLLKEYADGDDESNGEGMFQRVVVEEDSSDSRHGMGMGTMGMRGGMFGGGGMSMGGMGGHRPRITQSNRKTPAPDTKPMSKERENLLRNLLVLGYIRQFCEALPTKFFGILNHYYSSFDRWDWDSLKTNWTTKRRDLITIKRGGDEDGVWKNMYGLDAIHYDFKKADSKVWARANPARYSWTVRILDRLAMVDPVPNSDDESKSPVASNSMDTMTEEKSQKSDKSPKSKESFEIQFMDVVVGIVDTEQMPRNELSDSFHLKACGYGVFAGNGKVYDRKSEGWTKAFAPIQHGEMMSVHIEWMKRTEFDLLYGVKSTGDEDQGDVNMEEEQCNGHDEWCVALSFSKGEGYSHPPKGSVICLPSSTSYKLAVSSALKRWEIEWISARWTDGAQLQKQKQNEQMIKSEQ